MSLIPFKVTARTALLLGRENVATQKGAIIELVKNSYDADSKICFIYFDNKYSQLPTELSAEYMQDLIEHGVEKELILEVYERDLYSYILKGKPSKEDSLNRLQNECRKLDSLYIIDMGEGMTRWIIDNHWMMIGTDNKLKKAFTSNDRVKAGAKGIGRFALDRLGSKCTMTTFFNPDKHQLTDGERLIAGYEWVVNWKDFEAENATMNEVGADITEVQYGTLNAELAKISAHIDWDTYLTELPPFKADFGTILKITDLRDHWDEATVLALFSDLEVLVPPKDSEDFRIVVLSSSDPDSFGIVQSSVCDDFDYRLVARADNAQNVHIKIYRREYDVEAIPLAFFDRPNIAQNPEFHKSTFGSGFWEKYTTFSELLPGYSEVDVNGLLNQIGPFEFSFYFLKRSANKSDSQRFFYRGFASSVRKEWLNKFGGIKLFRDNFRVRPYGETKDVAFDWLGLGIRKTASPAGIAKIDGGYRVEPENVAGLIKISRLTNLNFEDKSSREGLQENNTFLRFKELIAKIINIFELDRSFIAREFDAFYNEMHGEAEQLEQIEKYAQSLLEREAEKDEVDPAPNQEAAKDAGESKRVLALARLNESKNATIERLEEEQKLLRALASSGIVSAAFAHDFSKLSGLLKNRVDTIRMLLDSKVTESDYVDTPDYLNPFVELEAMKRNDIKIRNWLNISLGFTRKDKRSRNFLIIKDYLTTFQIEWSQIFKQRAINFIVNANPTLGMRVFEIDLDAIFSNLVVNSIAAFRRSNQNEREISITSEVINKELIIEYKDNGPGLSKDIVNPEEVFQPLFTTTRDPKTGDEIGTGLGLWIVKSIVLENDGKINLIYPDVGFGIKISFPLKHGT